MTRGGAAEEFWPDPATVGQARRFLRVALSDLPGAFGPCLADTLLLAANELATNAVIHARAEFTVRVEVDPTLARVEASDENTRLPQLCLTPADAVTGRRLALIDGSRLEWGVDRYPTARPSGPRPAVDLYPHHRRRLSCPRPDGAAGPSQDGSTP